MNLFHYAILKKDNNYLAILTNPNTQWELGHYYDQGYSFFMFISAFNANTAINQAKENENSEIFKLQNELNYLRQENQRLSNEKFNNSSLDINNIDPLMVFGFSKTPTRDELKIKYKELSKKLHPDVGGSNFIMQIINKAKEQIDKII